MPRAKNGQVELEYESFGDEAAPTILLINGLGSQMTRWPADFCGKLAARGYRVIRMDNRDTGLSTWFKPGESYSLSDMAADAVAVLDAAGVAKAHVAGVSMGGMITQALAINHPDRVLSITSIMSATGAPGTLDPTPEAGAVLNTAPPDPKADFEAFLDFAVRNGETIGSPGYPWPPGALRERAAAEYARAFNPTGSARQMGAIRSDGDRTERLSKLKIPAVVLHGADDPLVRLAGGEATAAAIPGAELRVIPGMGHDLPPALHDTFIDAILAAVARA
ncbi:pimeloyl-ACP methyl ester carboxylesterase [Phenylobacterium haematophilum]|jgi:pimeloyl-ACP methyl ester carboxylesterase|uniref:Pimeloyl-ACP methyl ester carboxylesterase n=1 Tax=Phenylobacterium haematophilum TaxID=98513 RepID=A0A839ZYQ5_9CAUL|nr:alpha/beta hydrolase [Phenylobacterium haematophilum]MBB3891496.1 pimeloyl-ACP methyl ester carboxylesterase [Phenylobacterium haematophilum]